MRSPILVPPLGASPVVLSLWYAHTGDQVYAGDRLIEVMIDGATFDIPAPATGIFIEKQAWPDDTVTTGQVLGYVEAEGK